MPRWTQTAEERFWSRVDKRGNGECWPWTGAIHTAGYADFTVKGKRVYGHRFAYELLVGQVPSGLVIDHLCRNRRCVNPLHMQPVSNRENILRGVSPSARQAAQTHCGKGHPLSGDNLAIEKNGRRLCKRCHRARHRKNVTHILENCSALLRTQDDAAIYVPGLTPYDLDDVCGLCRFRWEAAERNGQEQRR